MNAKVKTNRRFSPYVVMQFFSSSHRNAVGGGWSTVDDPRRKYAYGRTEETKDTAWYKVDLSTSYVRTWYCFVHAACSWFWIFSSTKRFRSLAAESQHISWPMKMQHFNNSSLSALSVAGQILLMLLLSTRTRYRYVCTRSTTVAIDGMTRRM